MKTKKLKLLVFLALASVVFITGCKKDNYEAKVNECPVVVSTIPIDKAINVPLNQVVSATFNVKMNPATITGASFSLQQGATINAGLKSASLLTPVAGIISYSDKTAYFTPSSLLIPNTVYTGRVTTAAKDLIGQALQADYVWTFTTIAQVTLASNPTIGGTTSGAGTFNQGASVTVVATPNAGYVFTNWTENGVVVSTNSSYLFTMAANRTLVANFSLQFALTISSNPVLGGTTLGAGLYNTGTSVTAQALPNTGYTFVNWTDNGVIASTNASFVFVLTANRTLVANFAINALAPIVNSTSPGNGDKCVVPDKTVTAIFSEPMDPSNPATSFTLQQTLTSTPVAGVVTYSGTTASFNPSVNLLPNTLYTATITTGARSLAGIPLAADFVWKFNTGCNPIVTLSSSPDLGGTTNGSGSYSAGTSVTVTASKNTGYNFVNWTENGTEVSTNSNYQFIMPANNRTLVANFTAVAGTFTLNVIAVNGTVLKVPNKTDYNSGDIVTLTATPSVGYAFSSWSGDATGSSSTTIVTMNSDKNVTANFTLKQADTFTLNVTAVNGSVLKEPDLVFYPSGTNVQLTATANPGYTFTSWSGDDTGTASTLTVNMNADKNITANFTADVIPAGPLAIDLGCAEPFAILAGSTITSTGPSIITGDVGLSPGSALIGFPPGTIIGTTHIDAIGAAAKLCVTTAFIDGQSRSLNAISLPGQLGGLTLAPGLYSNSSSSGISGTGANGSLTLDAQGNANAVWIFQMGSTLTTDPATSIVLAGGAQAKNIFWIVGSSATLGTTSVFYGNILAQESITLNTGAILNGRALTQTAAVTIDASTITKP